MMQVDTDYRFVGPHGEVGLLDLRGPPETHHLPLFLRTRCRGLAGGRVHWTGCSLFADSTPHPAHLNARDTTFAFVSAAPQERIETYRQRMGWSVPLVHTHRG
jgi:predicted dithiol-disulfide oxidoreductase (DUF899 family)